ncbi:MAG: IclR family transcriptional regulator C-terminal domain-containing protein [Aeromicrobium sp.]
MTDERRDHLQTLERGLEVIGVFTGRGPLLSPAEISELTGLSKPIVRRIVLTLERLGYARNHEGHFALTPKVLELGYAYLSSVRLSDIARPPMERLTDTTGVGTSLAALDGDEIVYIDRVQRGRVASVSLAAGARLPAHATAIGHVLLAHSRPSEVEAVIDGRTLPALTEQTLTQPAHLRERFAIVRERGWAVVDQELEIGRRSAAAPVFDNDGRAIAALALSCGTMEWSVDRIVDELVPLLVGAAGQITAALGAGRREN